MLNLLAVNMAMSLTVEGSRDASELGAHLRLAVHRLTRPLLPAVAAGVALAPLPLAPRLAAALRAPRPREAGGMGGEVAA